MATTMTFDDYDPNTDEGKAFKHDVFKAICELCGYDEKTTDESSFTFSMADENTIKYHIKVGDEQIDSQVHPLQVTLTMEGCVQTARAIYYESLGY